MVRLRVLSFAVPLLVGGTGIGNAAGLDPSNVEALTSPAANRPWLADQPLPSLTRPDRSPGVPKQFTGPLSLAELTDLALILNPRTRQAWLSARAEAAALGIENADDWPTITALYSHRIGRAVSGTTGNPVPVQTLYGPSVSLSYTLFDFGQGAASSDAANFRLLAANLAQNRTLQEVATQVEQAYYRVLAFEYLVRASRDALKNFETALDATQRRRTSGLATAGDEYRAETQVGQAQLTLTRNDGELSKARGQLANAVGLPVNYNLQLKPVTELPTVSEVKQSLDVLIEKAKASRPDLIASEARARAARSAAVAASRAGLPTLSFVANYGRIMFTNSGQNIVGFGANAPATPAALQAAAVASGVQRAEQDVYQFGFNVSIPLFSGFKDTYSTRRAEEQAAQAESVRDQLLNQTELDVWQAYYDLQTAASSVASTGNLVKSATESAAASAARYKAGVGNLLDFITAQQDDTNARVAQIQSYLDWYSALARLNFSLGASDSEVIKARAK